MKGCKSFARVLAALAAAAAGAQQEQPLVRVNVDLVQVDAVVTDAKGNPVSDLRPDEFEVLDGGKPQRITNFSFLGGQAGAGHAEGRTEHGVASVRIAPEQVVRTMAIVVDDLGISEQSFAALRPALENFVERQVGTGDLTAIVTTSGRLGALQTLTSDKRVLRAAIGRLRSLPNHRPGVMEDEFTCVWFNHRFLGRSSATTQDEDAWLGAQPCPMDCPPELDPLLELQNDHRSEYYGRLSISALRRIVDGLRLLPGRKSMLLFTEGVPLVRGQGAGETNSALAEAYNAFLAHANRSAVAVNTIDPRGLIGAFATAERGAGCEEARSTELANTQQQLADIARHTGGVSIVNDNDLSAAMARVADEQEGYYLIGYKPSQAAEKGARGSLPVRRISIRVTRPGLRVRFHSSLYEEPKAEEARGDSARRLAAAVSSPFTVSKVRVRLRSRFWDAGAGAGEVLETALRIDARDLTFRAEKDGRRKAAFDILAVIFGTASKPLSTFEKRYTVTLAEAAYERALREGLVQRLELPLKDPGAYQLRGAVGDLQSDRIGSAGEFVEVPDLRRGRLALSGIALSDANGATDLGRYRAGQTVYYAYQVLNAKRGADGAIRVEVRAGLYREGRALGASASERVDAGAQTDPARLVVTKDFRLGRQLQPGTYTLRVTAVDRNARAKQDTAAESVDFEVGP